MYLRHLYNKHMRVENKIVTGFGWFEHITDVSHELVGTGYYYIYINKHLLESQWEFEKNKK